MNTDEKVHRRILSTEINSSEVDTQTVETEQRSKQTEATDRSDKTDRNGVEMLWRKRRVEGQITTSGFKASLYRTRHTMVIPSSDPYTIRMPWHKADTNDPISP